MSTVYHYTDTGRLPWILQAGELRPGRNKIGSFPDPDFLWATTSPLGDRTSSQNMGSLRSGVTRAVRFVLREDDFERWPDIVSRYPAWTPSEVARLEGSARGLSLPSDWRCRAEPLPRSRWVAIETRSYTNKHWKPLALDTEPYVGPEDYLGLKIEGRHYLSAQIQGPNGSAGYRVMLGEVAMSA